MPVLVIPIAAEIRACCWMNQDGIRTADFSLSVMLSQNMLTKMGWKGAVCVIAPLSRTLSIDFLLICGLNSVCHHWVWLKRQLRNSHVNCGCVCVIFITGILFALIGSVCRWSRCLEWYHFIWYLWVCWNVFVAGLTSCATAIVLYFVPACFALNFYLCHVVFVLFFGPDDKENSCRMTKYPY